MNTENTIEEFNFNVYITGAFETEEQKDRLKSLGDFISSLSDKLPGIKLSGYVTGIGAEECMKRIKDSDLFVVISDEMNDSSIFQIGFAYSTGLPMVLFTENPATKISELIDFTISCFVNNDKKLLDIFISQAYKAKKDVCDDMDHLSQMESSLQKEIEEFKEQEEKTTKERADQTKIFQMKQQSIQKGTQDVLDRSNVRIDELMKYKTQTAFIGIIE